MERKSECKVFLEGRTLQKNADPFGIFECYLFRPARQTFTATTMKMISADTRANQANRAGTPMAGSASRARKTKKPVQASQGNEIRVNRARAKVNPLAAPAPERTASQVAWLKPRAVVHGDFPSG
jgi:hypothetical protein